MPWRKINFMPPDALANLLGGGLVIGSMNSTVIGDLTFDDKGDVSAPGYVFYEWKDGTYDYTDM